MYLILDTETTGFPSDNKTPTDPSQAQICQLGAMLVSSRRRVVGELNFLIRPDGWEIPEALTRDVHGISTEMCREFGVPLALALQSLELFALKARLVICHNVPFDIKMLRLAHLRSSLGFDSVIPSIETYCTMLATTEICKLPKARGSGYKWPKLTEAYFHFFKEELDCAHDAMADVRGCARVFFELLDRETYKEAAGSDEQLNQSPL